MSSVNPVLTGFNPDPSVTRVGEDFFLATSSFEYLPGIPIYHSKDLLQWKLIGHALTRPSQIHIVGPEPGGGVWAPTLRYHDGTFYLATSSFSRFRPQQNERLFPRGFYVKTTDIWDSSKWSDPVYFDVVGLDQDLFWDSDESVFLSTTHPKADHKYDANNPRLDFAIHVCKIDLETGDSISPPKMIRESMTGIAEGSHIFRRGQYYYLVTAEGGTGCNHSVMVFRNDQGPLGEWQPCPNNPLMRSDIAHEVQNTGHADFFSDVNGYWWAALLGVRPRRQACGEWEASVFGRETFIVPVRWNDDWPIINNGEKISLTLESESHPDSRTTWIDSFSEPTMSIGWYRKNTPEKTDYCISSNPSRLRLYGGPYNLSVPGSPTMFLRKQTTRFCLWETRLTFNPTSEYEEAGALIWWNYLTFSSIGIRRLGCNDGTQSANANRVVSLHRPHQDTITRDLRSSASDVILYIRCGNKYQLGYREYSGIKDQDQTIEWLGEVSNQVMTQDPAIGLAFSGMMIGVYAFSKHHKSLNPVDFHYAQCKPEEDRDV